MLHVNGRRLLPLVPSGSHRPTATLQVVRYFGAGPAAGDGEGNTSRPPKRAWRSWQGSTSFSDSGYCRRSWSLCSTSEPRSTSTSTAERAVRLSALIWPRAPLCMEAAAATHLARSIALPAAPDHGLPGHDHHHECKRKDQRVVGDRVSH